MRAIRKTRSAPPAWLELATGEKLLFCGVSRARVRNPMAEGQRHHECVVLTDRRLVSLAIPNWLFKVRGQATVTTLPLSRIQAIQTTTCLDWSGKVLAGICFLLWVFPGFLALTFLPRKGDLTVNVVSGALRVEAKFDPSLRQEREEFLRRLDFHVSTLSPAGQVRSSGAVSEQPTPV